MTSLPIVTTPQDPFKDAQVLTLDGQSVGSSIEWNVGMALKRLKMGYVYQLPVLGGRGRRGGTVIDFLVYTVPLATPLWVQGDYWHGSAEKKEEDQFLMRQVKAAMGSGVTEPKQIWEYEALDIDAATASLKRILGL